MPAKAGKEKTLTAALDKTFRLSVIPAIFLLDRFSKIWVLDRFHDGEGFAVWPGVFHVTRVSNTGAAFGWWRSSPSFLLWITAFSVVVISWYLLVHRHAAARHFYGWALVLAGAAGNLYDRLRFGHVIDFLDLRVWPVFNLADASICLGVLWVCWGLLFDAPRSL